jgi:hypothetical protein
VLLGLAAMQPVLRTNSTERARTDARAFFVLDVSRSMLAASGPRERTRLERARSAARRLREAIPEVPVGVAGLTDRTLPYLFPTSNRTTFTTTIAEAVRDDAPPPQQVEHVASTFDAVGALGTKGFFRPDTRRRVCVVLTDGESRPFSAGNVARALRNGPGCKLVVVQFWSPTERIFDTDGRPEPQYRPSDSARQLAASLASTTDSRVYAEGDLAGAEQALRKAAGSGPTMTVGVGVRSVALAPYLALAALIPLLAGLMGRIEAFALRNDSTRSTMPAQVDD